MTTPSDPHDPYDILADLDLPPYPYEDTFDPLVRFADTAENALKMIRICPQDREVRRILDHPLMTPETIAMVWNDCWLISYPSRPTRKHILDELDREIVAMELRLDAKERARAWFQKQKIIDPETN